ncbi:Retrotransposon gag protein [Popillia japonica]|uniref:Retrotransposon gag protein n=1 Tax=Popillia japonica TaxID=7064 RepID=A0AAW1IX32_POPJA
MVSNQVSAGDRNNRKRLREFAGFPFKSGSDEYNAKLTYIKTNFTLSDLVVICNILCIDYKGANDEIISRLCDHLINIEKLEVNGRGEDSEDEDDVNSVTTHDNENTNQGRLVQGGNEAAIMATGPASFPINFRDVGDAVRKFSGDDDYPVQKWLDDVESLAVLVNWSGLHTFIYAKRQLIGLAKLFIESEKSISTWKDLRKALLNEFGERISSAQLHRALTERKMRKNETMQEYYLHMRELASRGSVEESITRSNEQTYPDVMAIDVTPETTLNIGVNATANQRKEIEELVFGYHPEKTKKTNVEMKIITTDDIPIYHTPRFGYHPEKTKKTNVEMKIITTDDIPIYHTPRRFGYHPEKTKKTNVEMKIITTDDIPIYHTPRRLPFAERKIVERQVDEWLENNVIAPCASDYSNLLQFPGDMQMDIVKMVHERNHFGKKKTEDVIRQDYHIPNLGTIS